MTYQISMFESEPDVFTTAIQRGSCFEHGKERILQAVNSRSRKDFVLFLKKEYGIGGWAGPGIPSVWFDGKGFFIDRFTENEQKYTWEQVADKIYELVATEKY